VFLQSLSHHFGGEDFSEKNVNLLKFVQVGNVL